MRYCSSCGQALGEGCEFCPVCGHTASDSSSQQKNPYDPEKYSHGAGVRISYKRPTLTWTLIAVNVAVFIIIRLAAIKNIDLTSVLSMHRGAVYSGEYYRLITSMFTHEGFFHLASNCYALLIYGMLLEPSAGKGRFAAVYFTGGILGNVLTFAFMKNPSIGASGAIFALLGAVLAIHLINPSGVSRSLAANAVFSVVLTTFYSVGTNINNLAHFGGLFGGYLMMCILIKVRIRKRAVTSRTLTALLLSLLFVLGTFSGIRADKSNEELYYGDYTHMCFYAALGDYEKAYPKAEKIASAEENLYSADALAAMIIYEEEIGEEAMAKAHYIRLSQVNQRVYMMDRNIYNRLTGERV